MSQPPATLNEEKQANPEIQPTQPKPGLRWLTYLLLLPLVTLATTFFGCISLVCGLWDKSVASSTPSPASGPASSCSSASRLSAAHRRRKLRLHEVAVYASNHLSYYDTPVLFSKLPFQFRIFAKLTLWKTPFIGWYLNRSGQVPVDQSSARASVASLNRGVATLKSGLPLVLFPEGGRAADGRTHVAFFLSGCAFMAIKAGVPLVLAHLLVGTYELLPIHVYHFNPRPLKIIVGDPIPTACHYTTRDADTLTQQLYDTITPPPTSSTTAKPAAYRTPRPLPYLSRCRFSTRCRKCSLSVFLLTPVSRTISPIVTRPCSLACSTICSDSSGSAASTIFSRSTFLASRLICC